MYKEIKISQMWSLLWGVGLKEGGKQIWTFHFFNEADGGAVVIIRAADPPAWINPVSRYTAWIHHGRRLHKTIIIIPLGRGRITFSYRGGVSFPMCHCDEQSFALLCQVWCDKANKLPAYTGAAVELLLMASAQSWKVFVTNGSRRSNHFPSVNDDVLLVEPATNLCNAIMKPSDLVEPSKHCTFAT